MIKLQNQIPIGLTLSFRIILRSPQTPVCGNSMVLPRFIKMQKLAFIQITYSSEFSKFILHSCPAASQTYNRPPSPSVLHPSKHHSPRVEFQGAERWKAVVGRWGVELGPFQRYGVGNQKHKTNCAFLWSLNSINSAAVLPRVCSPFPLLSSPGPHTQIPTQWRITSLRTCHLIQFSHFPLLQPGVAGTIIPILQVGKWKWTKIQYIDLKYIFYNDVYLLSNQAYQDIAVNQSFHFRRKSSASW